MLLPKPSPQKWTAKIKKWLAESPLPYSRKLDMLNRLPLLNEWQKSQVASPYFDTRFELFDYISSHIIGAQPITYLEFGVYGGTTIEYWVGLNKHPSSHFAGFDTFEGLPEDWNVYVGKLEEGTFTTNGQTPVIKDSRVQFVKGLFQDTLPGYLHSFQAQHQLVIHNDADLYSSTLYTLCTLHPFMRAGTIVLFDDFSHTLDEFRALDDYTKSFMRKYEVLGGAGEYYDRVAIRLLK